MDCLDNKTVREPADDETGTTKTGWVAHTVQYLESRRTIVIGTFLFMVCGLMVTRTQRQFWYDELFTVYISRLPSVANMWSALTAGFDSNPPLFYLLTRTATQLFGESQLTVRLPQMVGFLVMCVCLYRFVAHRCGTLYGFAAAVLPLTTMAFFYATEARPYGVVLGFSGVALVSWQRLVEGERKLIHSIFFAISLTGAVQSHAYALLIFVPFGCAEVVRMVQRRRIDPLVWLGLLVAAASAAVYVPLVGNYRGYLYLRYYAFAARFSSIPDAYSRIFGSAIWLIALVLLVILVRRKPDGGTVSCAQSVPLYEGVCVVILAMTPIAAVILARSLNGGFFPRYGLIGVIGVSASFCMLVHRSTNGDRASGAILTCVAFSWWIVTTTVWSLSGIGASGPDALQPIEWSRVGGQYPIVVSNALTFVENDNRLPDDMARRMVVLTDSKTAIAKTGTNVFDDGLQRASKWLPFRGRVVDYHQFLAEHRRFLVYGPSAYPEDWVIRQLTEDGVRLTLISQHSSPYGADAVLLKAEVPPDDASSDTPARPSA